MLLTSELLIALGRSKLFQRIALVLHIGALLLLLYSDIPVSLMILLLLFQLYHMVRILQEPFPSPDYYQLVYRAGRWILYGRCGISTFDNISIRFDGGVFILLRLNGATTKYLVIFVDQLDIKQYRMIRILERVMSTA